MLGQRSDVKMEIVFVYIEFIEIADRMIRFIKRNLYVVTLCKNDLRFLSGKIFASLKKRRLLKPEFLGGRYFAGAKCRKTSKENGLLIKFHKRRYLFNKESRYHIASITKPSKAIVKSFLPPTSNLNLFKVLIFVLNIAYFLMVKWFF